MTPADGLARMALGTLLASFEGAVVPSWVERFVDDGVGGVCLFGSNLAGGGSGFEAAGVTGRLHAVRSSVVVAIDEEGGDVTRLEASVGSSVPGNAALGELDDVGVTRGVAFALGRVLGSVGVDLDLAPCADVNVDPANPVIGVRSFGADPELVARHVAAYVEGLQGAGVAACAKHFPGHGATTVDSHLDLPRVDVPAEVALGRELVPFRAAVAAGTATIMTGHLVMPAFDERPATVSHALLADLLREELGFTGAVVTDALDMHGIGGPDAIPANVVRALAAGADLCCLGSGATDELVRACVEAVVGGVRSGSLDEERLADAAGRVAGIVAPFSRSCVFPVEPVASGTAIAGLATLGDVVARRALRVEGVLPAPLDGAHVVEVRRPPTIAAGEVPARLAAPLQQLDPTVTSSELAPEDGSRLPSSGAGSVIEGAEGRPLVIVVRDPQVLDGATETLDALLDARPDAVVVDLGWPAGTPRRGAARISTFGASRVSIAAVAALLAGRTSTSERTARG